MRKEEAFTLIEVLVVLAVIVILATIIFSYFGQTNEKARIARALQFSRTVNHGLGAVAVGVWRLDAIESGLTPDASGYGNEGAVTQGVSIDDGIISKSMSFNGTVNQYVIINPFNNFPSSEITVEFWMKSSDSSNNGTPFSYAVGKGSKDGNEFLIYNYKNFVIYIEGTDIKTGISGNDGLWHHFVVTWRSSNGKLDVFKDGELAFSGNLKTGYSIKGNGSVVFAQDQDDIGGDFEPDQAFLGNLDEMRVYREVLTTQRIREHYVKGLERHKMVSLTK